MRNLFGWSSPPKRKDRKYSRLRAAALQELIAAKAAHQIFVDIEEHGDGYVIPLSMMELLNSGDGTIQYGPYLTESDSSTAGTPAAITVPTGEIWKFHTIICAFLVDATVADRTAEFQVPSLGFVRVTAVADMFNNPDLTLSASQFGYIIATSRSGRDSITTIDNGSRGRTIDSMPMPLVVSGGGSVQAHITANPQAGDTVFIDAIYRRVK